MVNKKVVVLGVMIVTLAAVFSIFSCKKKETVEIVDGVKKVVITAATGGSPRPFTYKDESGELVGHNIELVEAIFARLPQYELRLEVTDFPSIFAGLDSDRYQLGVNNFSMNEERKEKYYFSAPTFVNRYIAAVRPDDARFGTEVSSLADLAGFTTLNSVGTNMATAIQNYNKTHPKALIKQSFGETNILQDLEQVEEGKWDFNLLDKPMFDYYVKDFGIKLRGIELGPDISGDLMATPYSYILIAKTPQNKQLVQDINTALREVIADGTSKRICEKYFGADYSPAL